MTSFAEVRPQDASPEIAAIYADIRAVSGVPVVNLIWRHFAALPGVLDWAWTTLRPLIGSQQTAAARSRLAAAVALPVLSVPGVDGWQRAGIDAAALAPVGAIIDGYIRGNLTNLLALTALRLRLDHPDWPAASFTPAPAIPPAEPLPPLPRIDALAPDLAAQVRALAAKHEGAGEGVIPSLYLALAPWPGLIAVLPDWLAPLYAAATLRAARDSALRAVAGEAAALLPAAAPPPAGVAAMRPGLDRFTRLVIPDLVPVCLALHRLLPGG